MKWITDNEEFSTQNRKKIKKEQQLYKQLKWRASSKDRANELVDKYYKQHADKMIIKGS